jgi:hypothetical protein
MEKATGERFAYTSQPKTAEDDDEDDWGAIARKDKRADAATRTRFSYSDVEQSFSFFRSGIVLALELGSAVDLALKELPRSRRGEKAQGLPWFGIRRRR